MAHLPPARPPFPVTAPYRVAPAPRPVEGPPGVEIDDAWPAALTRRLERLHGDADGVLVRAAACEDAGLTGALRAAWDLLPLPRDGHVVDVPHLRLRVDLEAAQAESTDAAAGPAAGAAAGPAAGAAADVGAARRLLQGLSGWRLLATGWLLACSDDLVVLHRRGPGLLTAELLAVSFPSGWPPRHRAGAGLLELHAPVADGERLQRAAPALSEALMTKGPLRQHVWGIDPDGRLDRDPSAPDAPHAPDPTDPAAWWLRVERQTSVPLPALDRALFTIRPHLSPLTALTAAQCGLVAGALTSMSPEALEYKGLTAIADSLVDWLRGRQFKVGSAG